MLFRSVANEQLEDKVRERTIEVVRQRDQIQKKTKEIVDSIHYAKRIQTAILPPQSLFTELFPECFIHYRPKDIVSGDFYWLEATDKYIFLAVADCTGHGDRKSVV